MCRDSLSWRDWIGVRRSTRIDRPSVRRARRVRVWQFEPGGAAMDQRLIVPAPGSASWPRSVRVRCVEPRKSDRDMRFC